jgi:hypothetical protein
MLEILRFVFSSFWHFAGTVILIWSLGLSIGIALSGLGPFVQRIGGKGE